MPKIIENVRERAVTEARRILEEEGYGAMTIRGVAKALGIAPGTIYHYFPSKETLAACAMLEDWNQRAESLEENCIGRTAEETVWILFSMVRSFTEAHVRSWTEYEPEGDRIAIRRRYHAVLVEQLSRPILRAMPPEQAEAKPWLASFLAELTLRFGSDGTSAYEVIEPAVSALLR